MTQRLIENITPADLRNALVQNAKKKVFLVTGKQSYKGSGAKQFIESALEGFEHIRFFDFDQNPKYEQAVQGVSHFLESNSDVIIAVGGGSVIDMAKLINAFAANTEVNSLDILQNPKLITSAGKMLIAIPTTAGTGSEATHFAVVYHEKKKFSVAHASILPEVAGLNYKLTLSQSPYLTACAGMDALSQAIESYWSVGGTAESKHYAAEAIDAIVKYLPEVVQFPNSTKREQLLKAAYLAGKAINISKTTAAHAMSYAFTTYYSIPHGHAVFLTLPEFFEYNYRVSEADSNEVRGADYTKECMDELCGLLGVRTPGEGKLFLKKFAADLGVELSLSALGIEDYESRIVDNVNLERLGNNPRKISREGLVGILSAK